MQRAVHWREPVLGHVVEVALGEEGHHEIIRTRGVGSGERRVGADPFRQICISTPLKGGAAWEAAREVARRPAGGERGLVDVQPQLRGMRV